MPPRGFALHSRVLCLLLFAASLSVSGQEGIDLSIHLSPQLRYVNSQANGRELVPGATVGDRGLAVGYNVGGAIEFRVIDELYLRAGIDFAHKRHHYTVQRLGSDITPSASRSNQVTYQALEIPVQAIYRFGFQRNANYLVGIGITALQFVGDPEVEAPLSSEDRTGFESLITTGRRVSLFGGYDKYLSDRFILTLEPYLAYVPDRILLESHTTARVGAEAGIRIRLTLDN